MNQHQATALQSYLAITPIDYLAKLKNGNVLSSAYRGQFWLQKSFLGLAGGHDPLFSLNHIRALIHDKLKCLSKSTKGMTGRTSPNTLLNRSGINNAAGILIGDKSWPN